MDAFFGCRHWTEIGVFMSATAATLDERLLLLLFVLALESLRFTCSPSAAPAKKNNQNDQINGNVIHWSANEYIFGHRQNKTTNFFLWHLTDHMIIIKWSNFEMYPEEMNFTFSGACTNNQQMFMLRILHRRLIYRFSLHFLPHR